MSPEIDNPPAAPTGPGITNPFEVVARMPRVSIGLQEEVQARGVAQAVVILENAPAARGAAAASLSSGGDLTDLAACFTKDERSITAMLSNVAGRAATRRRRAVAAAEDTDAGRRSYEEIPVMRTFAHLGIVLGDVHADGVVRLAQHARVRYVASSLALSPVRPLGGSSATLARATTWGIEKLEIPALWAQGLAGRGILIGHLDTGIDRNHEALQGAIANFLLTDLAGLPVDGAPASDSGSHGTHTAGTIVGRAVNGRHIGVAPQAQVCSASVIEGGNVVARILTGLDWAAGQGVRIVNLSLGLRGWHPDFLELMARLSERGILAVVATGNEGPGTSRSPGNYDNVLSVGACNQADAIPLFSSSEIFQRPRAPIVPTLVAPGVDVVSARVGGGYFQNSGTSMATPHISGLAALLWQAMPTASLAQIANAIAASCGRPATMQQQRANLGLPNARRALQALTGQAVPPAAAVAVRRKPYKRAAKKAATVRAAAKRQGGRTDTRARKRRQVRRLTAGRKRARKAGAKRR